MNATMQDLSHLDSSKALQNANPLTVPITQTSIPKLKQLQKSHCNYSQNIIE